MFLAACAGALLCGLASGAAAHPLAPSLLEIDEQDAGRAVVIWRRPLRGAPGVERSVELPPACRRGETLGTDVTSLAVTERFAIDCGGRSLVGLRFGVGGLDETRTDALLRVGLADGRVIQRVLRPGESAVTVPEATPSVFVLGDYAKLGAEHILTGADHLLFVFGLLLLVGGGRRLVATVTAFTLGHSVTLCLAALGFVHFPVRPIEVAIAATVFWLAVELAREPQAEGSWMRRAPWLMAGSFGLLHGLGFAGALTETGLPAGDVPLALLSFNLGIEAGQLAFVALALTALRALRALPVWAPRLPVYAMGSLAAFWCLERVASVFP